MLFHNSSGKYIKILRTVTTDTSKQVPLTKPRWDRTGPDRTGLDLIGSDWIGSDRQNSDRINSKIPAKSRHMKSRESIWKKVFRALVSIKS